MAYPDLTIASNAAAEAELVNRSGLTDATGGFNLINRIAAVVANMLVSHPLVKAQSPLGYGTGAGGAVTQATSRTTGVTLNTASGAITMVSAAGSTTPATFTVTNSLVAATDVIHVCQKSGTDIYTLSVSAVGAGSFNITFNTKSGTTTEQPVFNFVVMKAAVA